MNRMKKYDAQAKYAAKNRRTISLPVYTTERDIIEKLESVGNKSGYIKSLIRADIEKGKK